MVGALQRPTDHQHGALGSHRAGERDDPVFGDAAQRRGPCRILRLAVALAHDIGAHDLEAGRVACQERLVVKALADQHMAERQHHGGVAVGPKRQPFGVDAARCVVAHGRYVDQMRAVGHGVAQGGRRFVARRAAALDLRVAPGQSAKGDDELAVPLDPVPGGVVARQSVGAAENMRQDDFGCPVRVAQHRARIAADRVEEAMDLALRMMEAPRARPPIGAGVDRRVSMVRAHPVELCCDEIQRRFPGHLNESFAAAPPVRRRPVSLEPAAPDDGTRDAQVPMRGAEHRLADRRGIGVAAPWFHADEPAVLGADLVCPPMQGGEQGPGLLATRRWRIVPR